MSSSNPISGPVDFSKSIDKSTIKGKTALVTGGASGIGAATAKALAEAGAIVTIADINAEAGEKYAAELSSNGSNVTFIQTDVSDWTSLTQAFKHSIQYSPTNTIDIVLAIAGMNGHSLFQDSPFTSTPGSDPPPPSTKVLDVNLTGTYYTALLAIHYFRSTAPSPEAFAKADKQLIFVASNIAYFGIPLFSIYTASKAGVRGLWQSLRESPDVTGMRTNLVAPHIVRSPMTAFVQPVIDERGLRLTEIGEIVEVILRMVCDEGIRGRAVAVHPGKAYDTCDGNEEYEGATKYARAHKADTKGIWEFMDGLMRMGVQPGGQKE